MKNETGFSIFLLVACVGISFVFFGHLGEDKVAAVLAGVLLFGVVRAVIGAFRGLKK